MVQVPVTAEPHHQHAHSHHHHHRSPGTSGRAYLVGIVLNLGFVLIEGAFGFVAHSMALLADAGHNLSDVLGLAIAWTAARLALRQPTTRFTYGLRSSSILAALFNAIVLLVAVGGIIVEAVNRLAAPEPVASGMVMAVAGAGILVNGLTAALLWRGQHDDLNARGAFLHMVADTGVSLAVVAAGLAIYLTGRQWIDPAMSLAVALVIILGTWQLLRQSTSMALHAVPAGIDPDAVRGRLRRVAGVAAVHDLHIWPMSTTETALTCHLVMPDGHPGDQLLADLAHTLQHEFAIDHSTIQVETGDPAHPCRLVPDHVV
jgi:cobalt-zinc-cadmium efflux system protein